MTTPEKKSSQGHDGQGSDDRSVRGQLEGARRQSFSLMSIANLGLELGGVIILLTLIGWWIDKKLGTSPAFILGGVFIGVTGGMYKVFKASERFMKKK